MKDALVAETVSIALMGVLQTGAMQIKIGMRQDAAP